MKMFVVVGLALLLSTALAGPKEPVQGQETPVPRGPYLGQTPPGSTPELFAPGIVSTCHEHSSAMFTPGGTELWFGRMFPAAIYFMKLEAGLWTGPHRAPFGDEHGELYPRLSPDGSRLVFTSTRPTDPGGSPLGRGQGDLWLVERTDGDWTEPRHLGPEINLGMRHGGGSTTEGGTLYFSAQTTRSTGRTTDIYRAERVDGRYSAARRVDALSSDAPDHSPFVAPDESFVLFSSFRGGHGLSDLFITFRRDDGSWSVPRNLGPRINSPAKDEYPHVTPDGKYLFFNSNRVSSLNEKRVPDGPGNIYWVDSAVLDELR